jgi:hypothetical protein
VPQARNRVAFDSFILVDSVLHILQFTVAPRHGIKEGLVDFFSQDAFIDRLPPEKSNWRFVFVIPTGNEFTCKKIVNPRLTTFLNGVQFYSAQLDPGATRK